MVNKETLSAVIHIGTSSVSLLILEKNSLAEKKRNYLQDEVEFFDTSFPLGKEVFSQKKLSAHLVNNAITIVSHYMQVMNKIASNCRFCIYITNIIFEAVNYDILLIRLYHLTKQKSIIFDNAEITRLLYFKIKFNFQRLLSNEVINKNRLILHVGPGNTRSILLKKSRVADFFAIPLGVIRTSESIASYQNQDEERTVYLKQTIQSNVQAIMQKYQKAHIDNLIFVGYEIQTIAAYLDKNTDITTITIEQLKYVAQHLQTYDTEHIMQQFCVDYDTVDTLFIATQIYISLLKSFKISYVHVPTAHYDRGFLRAIFTMKNHLQSVNFAQEVLQHTKRIARQNRIDFKHAQHVAKLATLLFKKMQDIHLLSSYDLILLQVAAYLHEVGKLINQKTYYKHTQYIILHSDIFGLTSSDILLVALVARYHHSSFPKLKHETYRKLSDKLKEKVLKLAALLRIADSLDQQKIQHIKQIEIVINQRQVTLQINNTTDISGDIQFIQEKKKLFEYMYNYQIELVAKPLI